MLKSGNISLALLFRQLIKMQQIVLMNKQDSWLLLFLDKHIDILIKIKNSFKKLSFMQFYVYS